MDKGLPYREENRMFKWLAHSDECEVGPPPNKGRAGGETPTAVIVSATQTAQSFFPDSSLPHVYTHASLSVIGNTAFCPVCTDVLERPLELVCGRMICLGCLTRWVQVSHTLYLVPLLIRSHTQQQLHVVTESHHHGYPW